jgi:cell division septum initiation protein DivIVA
MNISEFAKPVTAKSLNESLARRYKTKINLESYTLSQLQNARNILRTKLSQVEVSESFSTVIESESYQKSKLMLDILNAAISERGDIDAEVLEAAKPDYIDIDSDGDTEEPMKKAVKDKEKKKKNESIVKEGAEDQAEIVMAAKEMVDRLTGWMEDVAEMKTESMLELADAIRDEMGSQQSQAWLDTIKPGLEELYAAMEVTRGSLSNGVGMLTGEGEVTPPPTEMGADEMGAEMPADDAAMEPTVDMEAGGDESFATAAPAAGGAEEAGRPARESIERKVKRESIDSRKLATKLASSKKK